LPASSQQWLAQRQVKTLYIEPGNPWQNGHVESFNGSLRDECLDREVMLSVAEARVLIEDYRRHYNQERPHGGIGYRTPAQAGAKLWAPVALRAPYAQSLIQLSRYL